MVSIEWMYLLSTLDTYDYCKQYNSLVTGNNSLVIVKSATKSDYDSD